MVKKSLFVLLGALLAAVPLTAQTGWLKNYGDEYTMKQAERFRKPRMAAMSFSETYLPQRVEAICGF